MPELTEIVWHLDTFAGMWLPDADLSAVAAWMDENGMDRCTAARPVDVRDGQVTYGVDRDGPNTRGPDRDIRTATVPLRTPPPQVWQPSCSAEALQRAQDVIAQHEWSLTYGGSCVDCSITWTDSQGRIKGRREDVVTYPCPPVRRALAEAGLPVPPPDDAQSLRMFGDTLDPVTNALAFGSPGTE